MTTKTAYASMIEQIFLSKFRKGMRELAFDREDIARTARELKVSLPKNLGDLVYSFRYHAKLPDTIRKKAGVGEEWIIRPAGRGKYRLALVPHKPLSPNPNMALTKVPDSTPGVVAMYSLNDEQALLARVRYNRLVDIFMGIACYSLQNHLRTTAPGVGQAETDELYIGIDKKGAHYILPIQAKGRNDRLSVVQIEQDIAVCAHKFPTLLCRPIGAQFMLDGVIALFAFERGPEGIAISAEKHYQLTPPDDVTLDDLETYRNRPAE